MHKGRPVVLIDTPGFSSATKTDLEVLSQISAWLSESYSSGIRLDGIIYLHRLSDPRMTAAAAQNLRVLRMLCGESNLGAVALVTTFWNLDDEEGNPDAGTVATNAERRDELENSPGLWKDMLDRGRVAMPYDDERSTGLVVVDYFIERGRKAVLDIQTEMVEKGLSVEETTAGVELQGSYGRDKRAYEVKIKELEDHLREMGVKCDKLEKEGREKRVNMEDLWRELGRVQERLREADTEHKEKILASQAKSKAQLQDAQEKLQVSETEQKKLAASNSEKDKCISDSHTRLETTEQAHAKTVNELNALKALMTREKDIRRPRNYNPALNVLDSVGEFPLYRASAGGHYSEVKSLLERGANPKFRTRYRWTSLHWAVNNGHYEVAKLLLDYGASPDAQSDDRATPRSMAKTDKMRQLLRQYEG